jgi:hypothetical protein
VTEFSYIIALNIQHYEHLLKLNRMSVEARKSVAQMLDEAKVEHIRALTHEAQVPRQ